jgi:hypothetical protein
MEPAHSTIDNLELLVGPVGQRAGAAFLLREQPNRSATWARGDGWNAAITTESRYIVVQGGRETAYTDTWETAHEVGLEALDIWSTRGIADLAIMDPNDEHIAFWGGPRGAILRIAGRQPLRTSASASIQTNGPQPPPPPETWHESMRFYRLSQLSDDLHDSLRNLWLAVENLLDDQVEQKVPAESEEAWLKRALKGAEHLINLESYLPRPAPGGGTPRAPHNAAYDYFYNTLRKDLFHAKASRQPKLPQEAEHAADFSVRHCELTRLYLALLEATTGVRRVGSGGLGYGGFEMVLAGLMKSPRLLLTNEAAPFDPAETDVEPPGRETVPSPARRAVNLERPGLGVLLGDMDGAAIEALAVVTRVMLEVDGTSAIALLITGRLSVRDVVLVEAQLGVVLQNHTEPKEFPR